MSLKFDAKWTDVLPFPLEVDRFVSAERGQNVAKYTRQLPSPLEVNRFISIRKASKSDYRNGFYPLSR